MRRSPDEAILTAVVAALRASSGVTALATNGIWNSVPQGTAFPYVEVTIPTSRREDTFSRYGADSTLDVKSISQAAGDQEGIRIREQVIGALNGQTLTLSGHTTLGLRWDTNERFEELVNGIRTRHHVASFLVWTEQSTS